MPSPRDPDELAEQSGHLIREGRNLRELSDRLIAEIETIRKLEGRARELPIGSREFEEVSREITDHVHYVFRMSAEQEALGVQARAQDRTINDIPPPEGEERPRPENEESTPT